MAKSPVQALGVRPRSPRHSESGDSARRMRTATAAGAQAHALGLRRLAHARCDLRPCSIPNTEPDSSST